MISPTSSELVRFCQIIRDHIGIEIAENDQPRLVPVLREHISALNMDSAQVYFMFLETTTEDSEREWQLLANQLRVGESYFLRDSGQMDLLEQVIFPELLQHNRIRRSLRILSAGCSSGEEVYSLAIVLDRIVPANELWDIEILGVDIDEQALNVARAGYYAEWSLRRVPDAIKSTYFEPQGSGWCIHPRIRTNVRFWCLNLVKNLDLAVGTIIPHMDCILCRNVFIYFGIDTIRYLTDAFAQALNPSGYLMTGHGELQGIKHPLLGVRSHANSVIYQRLTAEEQCEFKQNIPRLASLNEIKCQMSRPSIKPTKIIAQPNSQRHKPLHEHSLDISGLRRLFQQGKYAQVVTNGTSLLKQFPRKIEIWQLVAQAHANLGQYAEVEFCCNRLLEIDVFHAPAYFLLAHVVLEKGDQEQRKELLRKALYLDHNFIAPQLELAEIFDREGHTKRARSMRLAALRVLKSLPRDTVVDMLEGWTVQDLLAQMQELLHGVSET